VRDCLWVAETKEDRLLSLTVLTQKQTAMHAQLLP